jgi:vacuolar-type H+-ATPase subunit I/STV1
LKESYLHFTAKAASMKTYLLALVLVIYLLLAAPLGAQIYKYTDENGQKRWTDDLSQVPKEQRSSAQRIETSTQSPTDADIEAPLSPSSTEATDTDDQASAENAELSRDALEKEKAELDAIYQELLEERKALEQVKDDALSADDRTQLNDKISAYNDKTEQYETRLNAFNEKINAYNQKIMSKQAPQTD